MNIAALESEWSISTISAADYSARNALIKDFLKLPDEVFTKLRQFQPQTGCLNKCGFCSQSAGSKVWQFTESGLRNIIAAMKFVGAHKINGKDNPYLGIFDERGTFNGSFEMPKYGLVSYKRDYKPGILYAYLDNDPSLYPHLDKFLELLWKDLGVKTRITTVGYSRWNKTLQTAHENMNKRNAETVSKIVLSYTPYTFGWTGVGERTGRVSRKEFASDIENLLKTYKNSVISREKGFFSVELKFRPLVKFTDTHECSIDGRHIVHSGPYLLISKNKITNMNISKLKEIEGHSVILDNDPERYLMLTSNKFTIGNTWFDEAKGMVSKGISRVEDAFRHNNLSVITDVDFYVLSNNDGKYYSVNPKITDNGFFGKQFYVKTSSREKSGYIDSERYFLNALISYKQSKKLDRRSNFIEAAWDDVNTVIENIKRRAELYQATDVEVSKYIKTEILPLLETYVNCLKNAEYPASYFFDKSFTVDTGTICNLGKAFYEFKGLVSGENIPLTPQQERAYGVLSSLSQDKKVWRISPVPFIQTEAERTSNLIGKYNTTSKKELLSIQETDLSQRSNISPEKYITRQFYVELPPNSIEVLPYSDKIPYIPGSIPIELREQLKVEINNKQIV